MIIIFVLLWFGALCGMEIDQPKVQPSNVILPVPSLKELPRVRSLLLIVACRIACYVIRKEIPMEYIRPLPDEIRLPIEHGLARAVCSHLLDKKLSAETARQELPKDILKLIESCPKPFLHEGMLPYSLQLNALAVTPDHRYMLTMKSESEKEIVRLDLWTNKVIVVDKVTSDRWCDFPRVMALSPSGNRVALLSLIQLRVKDIAQNKVIAETGRAITGAEEEATFIKEDALLIRETIPLGKLDRPFQVWNIEKGLNGHTHTTRYIVLSKLLKNI